MPALCSYEEASLLRIANELYPEAVSVTLYRGLFACITLADGAAIFVPEEYLQRYLTPKECRR